MQLGKKRLINLKQAHRLLGGAIGLAKAIEYITDIGYDAIHEHVKALHAYTLEKLSKIKEG